MMGKPEKCNMRHNQDSKADRAGRHPVSAQIIVNALGKEQGSGDPSHGGRVLD